MELSGRYSSVIDALMAATALVPVFRARQMGEGFSVDRWR